MFIVSFEPPFSVGAGNLPETCGVYSIKEGCPFIRYQIWYTASRRTGVKGTKAHPTIHMPTIFANWGLPKSECLNGLCVIRENGTNSKAVPRKMTLKI